MLNHLLISGRLGSDPEIRQTEKGQIGLLSLGYIPYYRKKDGTYAETQWFKVVTFSKNLIKKFSLLQKGDYITIYGSLAIDKWEAPDGTIRKNVYIIPRDIIVGLPIHIKKERIEDKLAEDKSWLEEDPVEFNGEIKAPEPDDIDDDVPF